MFTELLSKLGLQSQRSKTRALDNAETMLHSEVARRPSATPLFILAPPRSFTSVICGMIGQHPEMYGLPEVNLFAADTYEGLGRLYYLRRGFRHGLLRAVAELGLGEQTEENIEAARIWLEEQRHLSIAELFHDLAEWAHPRQLVDKSPIYVYSEEALLRIRAAFPSAYYLHLLRHPKATNESIYKLRETVKEGLSNLPVGPGVRERMRGGHEGLANHERLANIDDPEVLWLEPHLRIMEFLDDIPAQQQLRVKGEDLMADLDRHLRQIAQWLAIRTDAEAIEAMKHPERSPFACYGPRNAKFGNDPSFMESPELRRYIPRTSELAGPLEGGPGTELSEDIREWATYFGY